MSSLQHQPVALQPATAPDPPAAPVVARDTAAHAVSPKVHWAAVASALATITWTMVAALVPTAFSAANIASLTGATATVLAFLGGFLAQDTLRH